MIHFGLDGQICLFKETVNSFLAFIEIIGDFGLLQNLLLVCTPSHYQLLDIIQAILLQASSLWSNLFQYNGSVPPNVLKNYISSKTNEL